ncbi:hypothetical protein GP486_005600 [Trichoglossum hirsutum]|uniref:Uncharacterized protein n=1 Tax=Trichoglossum hirsutum TaxID=265104 RepID=A0A9P8RLY2_9PEZI|nr:hypothetical protein GP486_005600 [Trichoglossum hirsutum]
MATTTIPQENSTRSTVEDSENDGSGDDAPEAVTLLSGQDQARSREEQVTQALERQEAGARRKRKERDIRLKEQAASSKRNKKRKSRLLEGDGPVYTEANSRLSTKSSLPALLPEEILSAVPAVRPPTPPLEREEQKQQPSVGKHKIFGDRPPKDMKSGPFSIRVLESTSKSLAPRVGRVSSSVKQRWLAGRPGRNGRGGIERRKVGGGFLRR